MIEVTYNDREFALSIAAMQSQMNAMSELYDRIGIFMVRSVQKNFSAGGRPTPWPASRAAELTGTKTMQRHRTLVKSIAYQRQRDGVRIGMSPEAAKYGTALHYGGTFTSRGKLFTVPLSARAARIREQVKSLREVKGLFFIKARGSAYDGLLAKRIGGKNARVEIWFKLARSIKVPPRPFMMMQDSDQRSIVRMAKKYVTTGRGELEGD